MIKHIYFVFRVIVAICFMVVVILPILFLVDLWKVDKYVHGGMLYGGFLAFGLGMKLANSWLSDEKIPLYIQRLTLAGKNEWFKVVLIYSALLSGGYLLLSQIVQKDDDTLIIILGIILLAVGFTCLHMKKTKGKS